MLTPVQVPFHLSRSVWVHAGPEWEISHTHVRVLTQSALYVSVCARACCVRLCVYRLPPNRAHVRVCVCVCVHVCVCVCVYTICHYDDEDCMRTVRINSKSVGGVSLRVQLIASRLRDLEWPVCAAKIAVAKADGMLD